ncbi:MAG: hypothetical protein JW912_01330 [Sedimentisphaerales bacterium]|nr:hypothetical protein [Sedimentisphaerales bacterium]
MARKKTVSTGKIFATLITISVIMLLLPQKGTKSLNFLFDEIFNPFLRYGMATAEEVFRMSSSSEEQISRSEYDKLWTAYHNLRSDLMAFHKKYEKLAKIRTSPPKSGAPIVLAEVLNSSISGLRQELLINRGQIDGIGVGQYVLVPGEHSIIGTISETSNAKSRVRLVTDAKHDLKVLIWSEAMKKYIEAQMIGDGKKSGKIPLISTEYEINTGDTVYAATKKGYLETPRIIGEISKISRDQNNPLLWDITVRPVYPAEELNDVAIIINEN